MNIFKTKCPTCGSTNTECTNWGERLGADAIGIAAGIAVGFFNRTMSGPVAAKTRQNCCQYKQYYCNNCGKHFSKWNS